MFLFLLLIKILFIFGQTNHEMILDQIFKGYILSEDIKMDNCPQKGKGYFHFQNRIFFINDILDSDNKNYNIYPLVYLPNEQYFKYVNLFPNTTIFIAFETNIHNESLFNKSYCYIRGTMNIKNNIPFSYVIISAKSNINIDKFLLSSIIILFLFLSFYSIIYIIKSCFLKIYQEIYLYQFTIISIIFSFFLIFSLFFIVVFLLSHVIYSFYKSYMIIRLIVLCNGFSILNFDFTQKQITKYNLYLFLFESITSILLSYSVYLMPNFESFYFFMYRNLMEHMILLIFIIRSFNLKFIPLYRQYKFEVHLRTRLIEIYRTKMIIYGKILLFGFLYSISFIILPFIELIMKININIRVFYINYYFNILIEFFLLIILGILFFPFKISIFYYFPIKYDYDSYNFITEIKEKDENVLNISNLKKNELKNEYQKNDFPIVFINPFIKKDNVFKGLHIGIIDK